MAALKTAVSNIAYSSPADAHSIHKTNPGETDIPNRVFVKGFPREATEEDLKNFFEEYGMVHESKIVKDKTGMFHRLKKASSIYAHFFQISFL